MSRVRIPSPAPIPQMSPGRPRINRSCVPIRARGAALGIAPIPVWSGWAVRSPGEPRRRPPGQRRPSPDRRHTTPARGSRTYVRRRMAAGNTKTEAVRTVRRRLSDEVARRSSADGPWSLVWTLMDPVSCVSCVSSCYCMNASETHATCHRESGMRYQHSSNRPDRRLDRAVSLSADRGVVPHLVPIGSNGRGDRGV
jgi:hypothetical protein